MTPVRGDDTGGWTITSSSDGAIGAVDDPTAEGPS
jgi:hypothetical protein